MTNGLEQLCIFVGGWNLMTVPVHRDASGMLSLRLSESKARAWANRLVEAACVTERQPLSGAEAVRLVTGGR